MGIKRPPSVSQGLMDDFAQGAELPEVPVEEPVEEELPVQETPLEREYSLFFEYMNGVNAAFEEMLRTCPSIEQICRFVAEVHAVVKVTNVAVLEMYAGDPDTRDPIAAIEYRRLGASLAGFAQNHKLNDAGIVTTFTSVELEQMIDSIAGAKKLEDGFDRWVSRELVDELMRVHFEEFFEAVFGLGIDDVIIADWESGRWLGALWATLKGEDGRREIIEGSNLREKLRPKVRALVEHYVDVAPEGDLEDLLRAVMRESYCLRRRVDLTGADDRFAALMGKVVSVRDVEERRDRYRESCGADVHNEVVDGLEAGLVKFGRVYVQVEDTEDVRERLRVLAEENENVGETVVIEPSLELFRCVEA